MDRNADGAMSRSEVHAVLYQRGRPCDENYIDTLFQDYGIRTRANSSSGSDSGNDVNGCDVIDLVEFKRLLPLLAAGSDIWSATANADAGAEDLGGSDRPTYIDSPGLLQHRRGHGHGDTADEDEEDEEQQEQEDEQPEQVEGGVAFSRGRRSATVGKMQPLGAGARAGAGVGPKKRRSMRLGEVGRIRSSDEANDIWDKLSPRAQVQDTSPSPAPFKPATARATPCDGGGGGGSSG